MYSCSTFDLEIIEIHSVMQDTQAGVAVEAKRNKTIILWAGEARMRSLVEHHQ